jgi:hypothetical protein
MFRNNECESSPASAGHAELSPTVGRALLNLSRSTGVQTRRLLLLTPDRNTKHAVAEVLLDGRSVIVDETYRVILKDSGKYEIDLNGKHLEGPTKRHDREHPLRLCM